MDVKRKVTEVPFIDAVTALWPLERNAVGLEMADEKKTLKFQMMMSPGEAEVLDDWMFRHRMRSRAEAIRRLTQIGMTLDRRSTELLEFLASGDAQKAHSKSREKLNAIAQSAPPSIQADLYETMAVMAEFESELLKRLYKMLIETWPLRSGIPVSEASQLRKELENKLDGLTKEEETDEVLRMIGIFSGRVKPEDSAG